MVLILPCFTVNPQELRTKKFVVLRSSATSCIGWIALVFKTSKLIHMISVKQTSKIGLYLFTYLLIYSFIYLLIHSFIHSFIYSFLSPLDSVASL